MGLGFLIYKMTTRTTTLRVFEESEKTDVTQEVTLPGKTRLLLLLATAG